MTTTIDISNRFTRPNNTTAYASGQLVANDTVAGNVVPVSLTLTQPLNNTFIRRMRLTKSNTGLTNAAFRVHLYKSLPTVANGDGAAWSTDKATDYLGHFDVTMDKAFTDGASGIGTPAVGAEVSVAAAQGTIYALLEARAAYTPAANEVFTINPETHKY